MPYICDDPVCDPCCDFCWYCQHNKDGVPVKCELNNINDFGDGVGYCDLFSCSLHEEKPDMQNMTGLEYNTPGGLNKISYDPVLKTYRKVYSLDGISLCFLSEFYTHDRHIIKYSIDIEAADDSHYEIDASQIEKLAINLNVEPDTKGLVTGLVNFFANNQANDIEQHLNRNSIEFHPYHYY